VDFSREQSEDLINDGCGIIERLIKFLHLRILGCAGISIC